MLEITNIFSNKGWLRKIHYLHHQNKSTQSPNITETTKKSKFENHFGKKIYETESHTNEEYLGKSLLHVNRDRLKHFITAGIRTERGWMDG